MVDQAAASAKLSANIQLSFEKQLPLKHCFRSREVIEELYDNQKMSAREIAAHLGCGHSSVNRVIKNLGITKAEARRRPAFGRPSPNKTVKQLAVEQRRVVEVRQLISKGWSLTAIAKRFNAKGYPSPSGRGIWTHAAIKRTNSPGTIRRKKTLIITSREEDK